MELPEPEALYVAVDDDPAEWNDLMTWLTRSLIMPVPDRVDTARAPNKRCSNARLHESGYEYLFPSFRDGYKDILGSAGF